MRTNEVKYDTLSEYLDDYVSYLKGNRKIIAQGVKNEENPLEENKWESAKRSWDWDRHKEAALWLHTDDQRQRASEICMEEQN